MFRPTESTAESSAHAAAEISASVMEELMAAESTLKVKNTEAGSESVINFENKQFSVVNSASYEQGRIARGSISSAFSGGGLPLSDTNAVASTQPLPTTLGGVRVNFKDADGNTVPAKIFFVSPQQINFEVPEAAVTDAAGNTTIEITYTDRQGRIASRYSDVKLAESAPGIFSTMSTGKDAPAGQTTTDGINFTSISRGGPDNLGIHVDAGSEDKPNFLILYGTGFRHAPAGSVTAEIGGISCPVTFAGKQDSNAGLDQINIKLDPRLQGINGGQPVDVVIKVNGVPANTTKIRFK